MRYQGSTDKHLRGTKISGLTSINIADNIVSNAHLTMVNGNAIYATVKAEVTCPNCQTKFTAT